MIELDDEEFIAMMSGELQEDIEQHINLAAERQNQDISWSEFRGEYK